MAIYHLTQKFVDVPLDDNWLSEGECEILAKMRFPKRRNDWRLGRWTAKKVLITYLDGLGMSCSNPALEVRAASDGAPEAYLNNERLPLSISISHSRDRGFSVLFPDKVELGCDLEYVENRDRDFLLDYFTEEEAALVDSQPASDRPLCLTLIWSAKESALKSLREGLRRDTKSVVVGFEISRAREEWNKLEARCTESNRIFYGWWRTRDQYVQTVTASRHSEKPVEL